MATQERDSINSREEHRGPSRREVLQVLGSAVLGLLTIGWFPKSEYPESNSEFEPPSRSTPKPTPPQPEKISQENSNKNFGTLGERFFNECKKEGEILELGGVTFGVHPSLSKIDSKYGVPVVGLKANPYYEAKWGKTPDQQIREVVEYMHQQAMDYQQREDGHLMWVYTPEAISAAFPNKQVLITRNTKIVVIYANVSSRWGDASGFFYNEKEDKLYILAPGPRKVDTQPEAHAYCIFVSILGILTLSSAAQHEGSPFSPPDSKRDSEFYAHFISTIEQVKNPPFLFVLR
ncbi:MAG: hypothetical protein ACPLKP_03935 [Microgenomates group bacterium]